MYLNVGDVSRGVPHNSSSAHNVYYKVEINDFYTKTGIPPTAWNIDCFLSPLF